MFAFSIWHWLIVILFVVLPIWLTARIVGKAGFSGWWGIVSIVPVLNLIMIWVFAFIDWPATSSGTLGEAGSDQTFSPPDQPV